MKMAEGLRLFIDRVHREGRGKEYTSLVKKLQAEGMTLYAARYKAAREMGYQGPKVERALYEDWQKLQRGRLMQANLEEQRESVREEVNAARKALDWDEIFIGLPEQADPMVEVNWVRAHPAMNRWRRQADKTKFVYVEAADIVGAPSRSAANMLVEWVNQPYEFQKQWVGEAKKRKAEDAASAASSRDMGIAEAQRILQQMGGAE